MCVYLDSISSLIHISLNNIDMFYIHIFVYVLSSFQIDFIVCNQNWLIKLPYLIVTQVLSARIKMTYYAAIRYQFNNTTSKKTFLSKN